MNKIKPFCATMFENAELLAKTLNKEAVIIISLTAEGHVSYGHSRDVKFIDLLGMVSFANKCIYADLDLVPENENQIHE